MVNHLAPLRVLGWILGGDLPATIHSETIADHIKKEKRENADTKVRSKKTDVIRISVRKAGNRMVYDCLSGSNLHNQPAQLALNL